MPEKTIKEIRDDARKLMEGRCRVCKICDGKACAGEVPGMGGLGTGSSFLNNVSALKDVRLNMRLLHEAAQPDTSTTLLGVDLSMPVMAAPIGGVDLNMGGGMSEQDYGMAVLGGCADSGVIGCSGDGVPPYIPESGFAAIKALDGRGIPFIKPWEGEELKTKLATAREAGATIFGSDMDAAGLVTLRQMGRPVAPKTPDQWAEIVDLIHSWDGKFILKGVMTPDEASMAVDLGVDAIVVSNHGGRVLDHTPGTAAALPHIVRATGGDLCILVDGGVRDGTDVVKMLALGANGVLIGRPFCVAALGGGREGVKTYLDTLRAQMTQAMVMTGCRTVAEIDNRIIF